MLISGAVPGLVRGVALEISSNRVVATLAPRSRRSEASVKGARAIGTDRTPLAAGQVRLTARTSVLAGSATLGTVSRLWVDRTTSALTHILVRPAGFFSRQPERIVALDLVADMRDEGLRLKIGAADYAELPVYRSDAAIDADIHLAFESVLPDPRAQRDVKVRVEDGHVTLSGVVDTSEQLEGARRAAAAISGVRGLTVDLVLDETIAQRVEAALTQMITERQIEGARVRTFSEHGIVYLEGRVPTGAAHVALERAAVGVPGVRVVVNNLSIGDEPPPARAAESGPLTLNR
jgi:osmotically-inducible protein OsmY